MMVLTHLRFVVCGKHLTGRRIVVARDFLAIQRETIEDLPLPFGPPTKTMAGLRGTNEFGTMSVEWNVVLARERVR